MDSSRYALAALRSATIVVVLALTFASAAQAVSITQHPLTGNTVSEAPEALASSARGLLVAGTSPLIGYARVNTGAGATLLAGPPGISAQRGLTTGPDGNIWYISSVPNPSGPAHEGIFDATETGVTTRFVYPGTTETPVSMVTGPDGALWLADDSPPAAIERYRPGGGLTTYPIRGAAVSMVDGPDGAVWFTNIGWNSIGRITPAGEVLEFALPAGAGPYGMTLGPDNALWFAEQGIGAIGRITTRDEFQQYLIPRPSGRKALAANSTPAPRSVTVGPEGAIWFTDPGDDSVGRVLNGAASEYEVPPLAGGEQVIKGEPAALPDTIALGPDGALWATEGNARAIARIDPNGTQPASPAATATPAKAARCARLARSRRHKSRYRSRSSACKTALRTAQRGATSPSDLAMPRRLNASASAATRSGTIVGKAEIGGGPHRAGRPSVYPAAHARIQVLSLSPVRVVVAKTTTDASGQLRVRVRPGRYLLTGKISPSIKCETSHSVLVRPRSIVGVGLSCPIK
jgi:virginiamycin B lyase